MIEWMVFFTTHLLIRIVVLSLMKCLFITHALVHGVIIILVNCYLYLFTISTSFIILYASYQNLCIVDCPSINSLLILILSHWSGLILISFVHYESLISFPLITIFHLLLLESPYPTFYQLIQISLFWYFIIWNFEYSEDDKEVFQVLKKVKEFLF